MIKACRDCRYATPHGDNAMCEHPKSLVELIDWYSGGTRTVPRSIRIMRGMDCGKDAKFFKPRDLVEG